MRLWVLLLVCWSLLPHQALGAPQNGTLSASDLSAINSTLPPISLNEVPAEFILVVETFPDRMIYIPYLWLMLFKFMLSAAQADFAARTTGFKGSGCGYFMEIEPEPPQRDQPFRLLNRHVVWAIQRLSEKLYQTRDYRELDATLQIYSLPIGRLTFRYNPLIGMNASREDLNLTMSDSEPGIWNTTSAIPAVNTTTLDQTTDNQSTAATSSLTTNDGRVLKIFTLPVAYPPTEISRIGTLLTLIRATADIAEKSATASADDNWAYSDRQTGIELSYRKLPAHEEVITWSRLTAMFQKFVKDFQEAGKFYEIEGRFVKLDPVAVFENFGVVVLKNPGLSTSVTEVYRA